MEADFIRAAADTLLANGGEGEALVVLKVKEYERLRAGMDTIHTERDFAPLSQHWKRWTVDDAYRKRYDKQHRENGYLQYEERDDPSVIITVQEYDRLLRKAKLTAEAEVDATEATATAETERKATYDQAEFRPGGDNKNSTSPNADTKIDDAFSLILQLFLPTGAEVKPDRPDRTQITTKDGGSISVRPDRITFEGAAINDHASHAATTALVNEMWGGSHVTGPKEFQLLAIAHGRAQKVKITGADEAAFTDDDWRTVAELEKQAAAFIPARPKPTATTTRISAPQPPA